MTSKGRNITFPNPKLIWKPMGNVSGNLVYETNNRVFSMNSKMIDDMNSFLGSPASQRDLLASFETLSNRVSYVYLIQINDDFFARQSRSPHWRCFTPTLLPIFCHIFLVHFASTLALLVLQPNPRSNKPTP